MSSIIRESGELIHHHRGPAGARLPTRTAATSRCDASEPAARGPHEKFFYFRTDESRRPGGASAFVGPVGLEPTTRGLKVRCSAN